MSAKKIFFYLFLIILVLGGIYFRPQLENIFLASKEKLADFTKNGLNETISNLETTVSAPPPLKSAEQAPNPVLTQAGTINWTNINRKNNGLPALQENQKLDKAALEKAQDIFAKQYFEHVSPTGKGPQDLAADVGYNYISIGENLALGNFAGDRDLLDAWMASPGHRENILHKGYKEIGVAVLAGVYQGEKTWVAVQEFGTPSSDCPPADVNLKKMIDANTAKVKDLENTLQSKKDQISKTHSSDSTLSSQIDEYNLMVKEYNALVAKTKGEIETYNKQVAGFNSCIKKFQQ